MNGLIYALNRVSVRALQKMTEYPSAMRFCIENGYITDCLIEEEIHTQTANPSVDSE